MADSQIQTSPSFLSIISHVSDPIVQLLLLILNAYCSYAFVREHTTLLSRP